jgi:predicted GNAT family acetyltransferase
VSFCWHTPVSSTVRIGRVGGVYTPPALRGHGYASANVAAASQHALDSGAVACMLYTDRANPTSNRIYQALGYRPVGDAQEWLLRLS